MEFYAISFKEHENIQINDFLEKISFLDENNCCLKFVVNEEGLFVIYRSKLTENEIKNLC